MGRPTCPRCRRPESACWCAAVRPVDTRTRLVLLQHPRERDVAIGTARMAHLCLTRSELHVGVDWGRSPELARVLADRERPPVLLYPGPGAIDIVAAPPPGPVTLIVVDGTWAQTKKVVRTNAVLAQLPRYAFVPPRPSDYRIRKEPDAVSVATIEALVHALSALEGDPGRFEALLEPFRRMIDFQLECEVRHRAEPSRHVAFRERPRRQGVPRVFSERYADLVCVAAEANAWPYPPGARRPDTEANENRRPDEIVHWAAHRPATGETLSVIVAPRGELAPGTVGHTGLDAALLRGGASLDELHRRWETWVRPGDIIASWGHYEPALFAGTGGRLPDPATRLDLRHIAREVTRRRIGSLSQFQASVTPDAAAPLAPGRAGRKLRAIADIVRSFHDRTAGAQQIGDESDRQWKDS